MISKIECQIHKGQKITAICVDSFCTANTKCCQTCVKELHDVHDQKLVSLDSLQQFISNQEIIKKQNQEYNIVKQQLIAIRLELAELTELFDQKIDSLNKNQLGFNMQIDQLLQNNSDELAIVKILLNQYEINNYQVIGINEQMKKKMEMQISQITQQISQYTSEYTKKVKQQMSKLSVEQFKEELKFSDIYKHKHVQLSEGKTATLTQQIGYAVVFSDNCFDPSKESFKCSFVINKLSYGLVGFGYLDECKAMQYQIYDFSKGHGFFALQNTGVIYNSDDVSANNTKVKSLTYDKQDQINCQYDAQMKQFTFMKESDKNEKYSMKLLDTSKKLFPVAILYGPGDSISFV